jgi:hypothetical protein
MHRLYGITNKKCQITEASIDNNISNDNTVTNQNDSDMVDTMMQLIKQNQEFKEIIKKS